MKIHCCENGCLINLDIDYAHLSISRNRIAGTHSCYVCDAKFQNWKGVEEGDQNNQILEHFFARKDDSVRKFLISYWARVLLVEGGVCQQDVTSTIECCKAASAIVGGLDLSPVELTALVSVLEVGSGQDREGIVEQWGRAGEEFGRIGL